MAEPTIKFGTQTNFGTQTGWAAQAPTSGVVSQRASATGPTGNEVASKLHDEMTNYSQEFVAASATVAPTISPTIGALIGSGILTSITINTSATDFHKQSLTGHQHSDNAHANTLLQAAHGISLSTAFGGVDFLGGTAGDNASVESSSITISCSHIDKPAADGDHLIGQNFTGKISATVTWIGVPTVSATTGWDVTSVETSESSVDFVKTTVTAEKALDLTAPA